MFNLNFKILFCFSRKEERDERIFTSSRIKQWRRSSNSSIYIILHDFIVSAIAFVWTKYESLVVENSVLPQSSIIVLSILLIWMNGVEFSGLLLLALSWNIFVPSERNLDDSIKWWTLSCSRLQVKFTVFSEELCRLKREEKDV